MSIAEEDCPDCYAQDLCCNGKCISPTNDQCGDCDDKVTIPCRRMLWVAAYALTNQPAAYGHAEALPGEQLDSLACVALACNSNCPDHEC